MSVIIIVCVHFPDNRYSAIGTCNLTVLLILHGGYTFIIVQMIICSLLLIHSVNFVKEIILFLKNILNRSAKGFAIANAVKLLTS